MRAASLVTVLLLLVAACAKAPVALLEMRISRGDWTDYHRSLQVIDARQTPAERTEFARALQELKFQAMAAGDHAGPQISAALRQQIAGWTVRDVLVLGLTMTVDRKREEEKALLRSIRKNHTLRTKPGDTASATFLASVHVNQDQQLATLRAEIAALESRLNELDPNHPQRPAVVPLKQLDAAPVRTT